VVRSLMEKIYSIICHSIWLCIFLSIKIALPKQKQWLQAKNSDSQIKSALNQKTILQRFYHHC
jgi:hypothetical protein